MKTQERNNDWQALAEAIREELRECAWLLALLDKQQKAILARDARRLVELTDSIREQHALIHQCGEVRAELMLKVCQVQKLPDGSLLSDIAGSTPVVLQPLFEALVREGTSLRRRIRTLSERNHRILERSSEDTAELLELVRPGHVTRTYGPRGAMRTSSGLNGRMVHTAV
jgi:flagellar biosynthesis/type III secretory pathway chaperone